MSCSVAPSILLESKSEVEGGAVFLCARDATINGIIDASGMVCFEYGRYE